MLLHKSVEHDSRVRREAKALAAAGHDVTVVHLPRERHGAARDARTASGRLRDCRRAGFGGCCRSTHTGWPSCAASCGALRASRPDVVHAHDAPMLAPGLWPPGLARARLVYDSHELATGVPYRERRGRGSCRRSNGSRCRAAPQ